MSPCMVGKQSEEDGRGSMDWLRPSRSANESQERHPDHGPVDTGRNDRYDRDRE